MTEYNNEVTLEEMKQMIEKHVKIDGLSVQGIRIIYEDIKAHQAIKRPEEGQH